MKIQGRNRPSQDVNDVSDQAPFVHVEVVADELTNLNPASQTTVAVLPVFACVPLSPPEILMVAFSVVK